MNRQVYDKYTLAMLVEIYDQDNMAGLRGVIMWYFADNEVAEHGRLTV